MFIMFLFVNCYLLNFKLLFKFSRSASISTQPLIIIVLWYTFHLAAKIILIGVYVPLSRILKYSCCLLGYLVLKLWCWTWLVACHFINYWDDNGMPLKATQIKHTIIYLPNTVLADLPNDPSVFLRLAEGPGLFISEESASLIRRPSLSCHSCIWPGGATGSLWPAPEVWDGCPYL